MALTDKKSAQLAFFFEIFKTQKNNKVILQ